MFCGNDILAYDQAIVVQANRVIDIDATTFHQCLMTYSGTVSGATASRQSRVQHWRPRGVR